VRTAPNSVSSRRCVPALRRQGHAAHFPTKVQTGRGPHGISLPTRGSASACDSIAARQALGGVFPSGRVWPPRKPPPHTPARTASTFGGNPLANRTAKAVLASFCKPWLLRSGANDIAAAEAKTRFRSTAIPPVLSEVRGEDCWSRQGRGAIGDRRQRLRDHKLLTVGPRQCLGRFHRAADRHRCRNRASVACLERACVQLSGGQLNDAGDERLSATSSIRRPARRTSWRNMLIASVGAMKQTEGT